MVLSIDSQRLSACSFTDAPEVDQSVYAPQHYPLPEGLQRPFGDDPELFLNTEPPEPTQTGTEKELSLVQRTFQRKFQRKPLLTGILFGLVIVAIGLGGGLGLGLHNPQASNSSASASTVSPSQPPLVNGALKDTSLASTSTADGNRHVFFQDINGTLRHAQFSAATNGWLPSIDFLLTEQQPRNHTPISAIQALPLDDRDAEINIYFVDVNDTLSAVQYSISPVGLLGAADLLNETIPVSSSARSLSVSRLLSNGSNIEDEYLLFYENPNNGVSVMHGQYINALKAEGGGQKAYAYVWAWNNVSELFYLEDPDELDGSRLSAPFSVIFSDDGSLFGNFYNSESINNHSSATCYDWHISNFSALSQYFNLTDNTFSAYLYDSPETLDQNMTSSILSSGKADLLSFGLYSAFVNNGTLSSYYYGSPDSSFPFGRLASINGNGSLYLYHQLNESILMEEVVQSSLGSHGWGEPSVLHIPTNP